MPHSTALITRTAPAGLAETDSAEAAYTRRLFDSFYEVFAAVRQPERAIFWYGNARDKATVWHVRDPKNRQPGKDQLVGQTINDLDAVRIMIGNWAAGCKLTTIRWELYDSLRLTNEVDMGRFDFFDLAGDIDATKAKWLRQQSIFPHNDWDFDAVALMHFCHQCRKACNHQSVLYRSNQPCPHCGQLPNAANSFQTIQALMLGYSVRLDRVATFPTQTRKSEFALQNFVDPIPNAVMYWLLTMMYGGSYQPKADMLFGDSKGAVLGEWLTVMYNRSLFHLMATNSTRKAFQRYLKEKGVNIEVTLAAWRTIGEALRTPLEKAMADRRRDPVIGQCIDSAVSFARDSFPLLFNTLVLGHLDPEERTDQP